MQLMPMHNCGSIVPDLLLPACLPVRFKSLIGSIPDILAAPETSIEERLKVSYGPRKHGAAAPAN